MRYKTCPLCGETDCSHVRELRALRRHALLRFWLNVLVIASVMISAGIVGWMAGGW